MAKVHASLFSGFGAADLAATWMGWENAFWCEIDDFPRTVLSYRFPKSEKYGNIKETDFTSWRGKIDVLTGGFPCQPFSLAGQRKGSDDDRYLWPEMLRAIREIRPTWVIGENVAGILSMVQPGSEVTVESQTSLFEEADKETLLEEDSVVESVCRDLEQEGYSVQPIVIPACAVAAPHPRARVFFIAHRADTGAEGLQREREDGVHEPGVVANTHRQGSIQFGNGRGICNEEQHRSDKKLERNEQPVGTGSGDKKHAVTHSNGQKLQARFKARRWQNSSEARTRLDDGTKRFGGLRFASDPYKFNGDISGFCSGELSQLQTSGIRIDTNAYNKRCAKQCLMSESDRQGFNSRSCNADRNRRDWRDFPTQPPVCRGNDGLPFDVVRLTISLTAWCTGSIKGYGNAIVPQVMFEIFKAIEEAEKQFKDRHN